MRLFLSFRDVDSLVRYLSEELDKLRLARNHLEEEIRRDSLVDIIEVRDNDVTIKRDRATVLKGVLDKVNERIEIIDALLNELRNELGIESYEGLVLLEVDDGVPQRILLSQRLMGEFS